MTSLTRRPWTVARAVSMASITSGMVAGISADQGCGAPVGAQHHLHGGVLPDADDAEITDPRGAEGDVLQLPDLLRHDQTRAVNALRDGRPAPPRGHLDRGAESP